MWLTLALKVVPSELNQTLFFVALPAPDISESVISTSLLDTGIDLGLNAGARDDLFQSLGGHSAPSLYVEDAVLMDLAADDANSGNSKTEKAFAALGEDGIGTSLPRLM